MKRMKLITEAEYDRYIAQKIPTIRTNLEDQAIARTSDQASNLLKLGDIPDDIKAALYNSLVRSNISKFKKLSLDEAKPLKLKETTENDISYIGNVFEELSDTDKYLVDLLPLRYRHGSRQLLLYLKRAPELISWDITGTCTFYGEVAPDSNLVDLLSFTLNSNKKAVVPAGVNRFFFILKLLNIPSSILPVRLRSTFSKNTLDNLQEKQRVSLTSTPVVSNRPPLSELSRRKRRQGRSFTPITTVNSGSRDDLTSAEPSPKRQKHQENPETSPPNTESNTVNWSNWITW